MPKTKKQKPVAPPPLKPVLSDGVIITVLLTDAEYRLLCLLSRGGRRACVVRPARALQRLAELDLVEINRDSDTAEVTEAGWDWLTGE